MLTRLTQRWRAGKACYRPVGETIQTRHYEVAEIEDDATARAFCLQTHYSGSYPAARVRIGLYHHELLVGVAVFSHPSSDKVLTNYFPGAARESIELGRFVLLDAVPSNGETYFLARCRALLRTGALKAVNQKFIGLISFSDDVARTDAANRICFAGHTGTIYQASNAVYASRATARTLRLLPDGRVFSDRAASKIRTGERGWRYASQQLVAFGATPAPESEEERRRWLTEWTQRLTRPLKHKGNHRYLWALDKRVKLPAPLPYPKLDDRQLQPVLFG